VGQRLRPARSKVANARCRVGRVRYKAAGRRKKGRVLAQSPRPGTRLRAGARINLVVGR
jgi:beta-lactam-binding protein with PASTA domain